MAVGRAGATRIDFVRIGQATFRIVGDNARIGKVCAAEGACA